MSQSSVGVEFLGLLAPIRDSLYRYARRALPADVANDALQDVVLTAWREFGSFQRGTNFKAWMFKIMLITANRYRSRKARRREVELEEDRLDPADQLDREVAWASILEDPARMLEALDDCVLHALDGLSSAERDALQLRLLEGLSYKEIAEAMQIPVGTVMSHIHRGRIKLRRQLAEYAIESGLIKGENL